MLLSKPEADAIGARIAGIERATGVQVVTAIVARSDAYPELAWNAFALGVAVSALIVVAFDIVWPDWMLRRNGVLLFASVFERCVEILADIGFADRVSEREWHTVIDAMTPSLAAAKPAEAFALGLDRVEALFAQKGIHGHGERNELPDRPILGEDA